MKRIHRIASQIVGYAILAGFLAGLFLVIAVPIEMIQMEWASHWPSRKGTITLSYARYVSSAGKAGYWKPEIAGTYSDSGERFHVTRVRYGDIRWGSGKRKCDAEVAKYPIGLEVDVHVCPTNPRSVILEKGGPRTTMVVLLATGTVLFLLPFFLYLGGRLVGWKPS